jgi:hypothetical protein
MNDLIKLVMNGLTDEEKHNLTEESLMVIVKREVAKFESFKETYFENPQARKEEDYVTTN